MAMLACRAEAPEPASGRASAPGSLVVYATSYPLAYFAERIGGKAVQVVFEVPEGLDPAHWSADPEAIARAQSADLLLRHGVGDPGWLELASLHRDRVVDTTAAVRERLLREETVRHQHGPDGEHSHGARAGTSWLDPTLATAEAEAIADALAERRPEEGAAFRSNLAALTEDLDALDRAQLRAAERLGRAPIFFSHPVYAYLQARYGLNGRSVSWEPDAPPSDADWRSLSTLLEEHPAELMLWEAEPLPETAARLAALGIESRVFAPCVNRPSDGQDWLAVMQANRADRPSR
jgi:zinc transport system substrate-binding protein